MSVSKSSLGSMKRVDITGVSVTSPVERTRKRLRDVSTWRYTHSVFIVEGTSKASLASYYATPLEPAIVATVVCLLYIYIVAMRFHLLSFHELSTDCAFRQHRSPLHRASVRLLPRFLPTEHIILTRVLRQALPSVFLSSGRGFSRTGSRLRTGEPWLLSLVGL